MKCFCGLFCKQKSKRLMLIVLDGDEPPVQ